MKRVTLLILYIFIALISNADETDSLKNANELYIKGEFQKASAAYENILNQGYESAEIYYNLGNSYYKQNLIAKAILNYEKALLLSPNDNDIKYNLEMSNRFVVDKIEVLPVFFITGWVRNLRNLLSSNNWAIISIVLFFIALIFISLYLYSRGIGLKKLSFWLGFLIIVGSLISFVFSYQQKQIIISGNTAIVMGSSVTVKSSPDMSGTDLFVIHEGTKVWIEDKVSGWNEIKLSDGSKGWIETENIAII